jgi:hypothetical protein
MQHIRKFGRLAGTKALRTPQWSCFYPTSPKFTGLHSYQFNNFSTTEQTPEKGAANVKISFNPYF